MADALLRTKLMPPPAHADLIERARLHTLLRGGLRLPLTLVVAQAGAGKTSLIRCWRAGDEGRDMPLAWLALDEDDNDPVRFWRYVIAALETLSPAYTEAAQAALDATQESSIQPALITLINSLADLEQTWVLALDDYHLIDTPVIHEQVTFFLENLPASLRVLMLTRADPPLPLARWRARGQMAEIRNADLRFTEQETAELVRIELDGALHDEQIARLTARTEGWAAGLHLAALALRNREDADEFLEAFTGSHQFVLTYLAEDVLDRLPDHVQDFLLQTSILSQLSAPLCDAVTARDDSEDMLRELARINLFTMPLDEQGNWYRYHHLFAGVLQHQLQHRAPERVADLHLRASEWYEGQELVSQSIDHALRGQHIDRAAQLIERAVPATLVTGEARLVRRWLDTIPPEIVERDVDLLMAGAWSQLLIGPLDQVQDWIDRAAAAFEWDATVVPSEWRGEAAALRALVCSFQGRIQETIDEAEIALENLPEHHRILRGMVRMSMGQAYRFDSRLDEAAQAYREAVELGLAAGNLYAAIDSLADLGVVLMRQGKLREADEMLQRGHRELEERNALNLPVAGAVFTIWPEILHEMNQPERALELATRGLELGKLGQKADLMLNGNRSIGTAYWSMRDRENALAFIAEAARIAREYGLVHTARATEAKMAHIHLTFGELAPAQAWAARYEPDPALPGMAGEVEQMMLARVCIASGDPASATGILQPLVVPAEREGRVLSSIEIHLLSALAHQAAGNATRALEHMSTALRLAAPEGYIRKFLDEGPDVANLLTAAVAANREAAFATSLLSLLNRAPSASSPSAATTSDALIEPLSDREQAVLRLLCAGLSAPEIADELYVAASTVRTHLKNLYRKLDVHSRDQAISRARELNLA